MMFFVKLRLTVIRQGHAHSGRFIGEEGCALSGLERWTSSRRSNVSPVQMEIRERGTAQNKALEALGILRDLRQGHLLRHVEVSDQCYQSCRLREGHGAARSRFR